MRLLLVATVLFTSWPARAEPDAATVGAARRLFDDGVAAIERQAYADALDSFQRSAALVPRPVTTFNIGMCQRALADLPAAYVTLQEYLVVAGDEPAERRAEAARVVLELDAVLATVTVRVDEPGAEVRVDGRTVGASPVREPLRLLAGPHVFEAHRDGFVTAREELELAAGEALAVELRLSPGAYDVGAGEGDEGGIEAEWWFWTILGAVVVGGAVTAGVLLWPEDEVTAADWRVEFR